MKGRVLIVDDDTALSEMLGIVLRSEGFLPSFVADGERALAAFREARPDIVLLDLMLPGMSGIDVARAIRAESGIPIVMLTAKSDTVDVVLGLESGADDYVVKPFDTLELVARVRGTLRRNQEFREVSPLTGLPGNQRILREVGDRMRLGVPFAVCYCDIDGFKAVNDAYGFARGDEFIVTLGRKLLVAVATASPPAFLGHIGGDDFVVICQQDQIRPLTERAVSEFEAASDELYDEEDRDRGYVAVKSRRDGVKEVGLVTVSVGVALSTRRHYTDPREIVADASEMKTVAKGQPGSYVAVDRRTGL